MKTDGRTERHDGVTSRVSQFRETRLQINVEIFIYQKALTEDRHYSNKS
jgi:hypothetical protein